MLGKVVTLGFWLSDTALEAAVVRPGRKASKTIATAAVAGEGLLTSSDRSKRLTEAFRVCLKKMPRVVRRADTPAVLALPDRLVVEDVFDFAEFPKAQSEAQALVAHRLSREMNVLPDEIDVSWDRLASADGAEHIRVRAMQSALRKDIETAATAAGVRLVRIDGWAGFASAASQIANQDAGSVVWCDGAEWSLLCWG
ncbi:MAG: hypothetical protein HKN27_03305, partial [Silicimonas sp.]|nr:hypothetical protein [Silicimonas sp.]